jgi:hypothetical protein
MQVSVLHTCLASVGIAGLVAGYNSKPGAKLRFAMTRPLQKIPQVKLDATTPVVVNPNASKVVDLALGSSTGGVQVLFSPPGSGKSTYIAKRLQDKRDDGDSVELLFNVANKEALCEKLNCSHHYMLSDVLPNGTVLVLDQMDFSALDVALKDMIVELATNSRNTQAYSVVICVSKLEVATSILSLNGHDKIRQAGSPQSFQWNEDMVTEFINRSPTFSTWNSKEKAELAKLGSRAACPGFMFWITTLDRIDLTDPMISITAAKYKAAWDAINLTNSQHLRQIDGRNAPK